MRCNICRLKLKKGEGRKDPGNKIVCLKCWKEHFGVCNGCGLKYWLEDLERYEGSLYCETCMQERNIIHNYSYQPQYNFTKMEKEYPLYMGIELEIMNQKQEKEDLAKSMRSFLKEEGIYEHFYFKRDSSVPDGFEIVTHPHTLRWSHHHMKWNKILRWLKEKQSYSHLGGKCGLHIHLDTNYFTRLDKIKMRIFFSKNANYLHKLSGRKEKNTNFCAYETHSWQCLLDEVPQANRNHALNFITHKSTLEFRMFRGTLDNDTFISALQFSEAISFFIKDIGISSLVIGEEPYQNNSWGLFTKWCKIKPEYQKLVRKMKEEKICV